MKPISYYEQYSRTNSVLNKRALDQQRKGAGKQDEIYSITNSVDYNEII